ncbi:MAG: response regulator [Sandaracinaceae bacterium]
MASERPFHLMIAEDDPEMRSLLGRALRRDTYQVTLAPDAHSLLRALDQLDALSSGPDLIVSDVRMPGATGLDLVRLLRARGLPIPIVLVSAFASAELYRAATDAGASYLMSKPFDMDDLRTVVMNLLVSRRGHSAPLL